MATTDGPALSVTWLSTKLGIDTVLINAVLQRRGGIAGQGRLLDDLLNGHVEHVVATINAA